MCQIYVRIQINSVRKIYSKNDNEKYINIKTFVDNFILLNRIK